MRVVRQYRLPDTLSKEIAIKQYQNEWHQLVSRLEPLLFILPSSSFNGCVSRLCQVCLSLNCLPATGTVLSIPWVVTHQTQVCRHRVLSGFPCYIIRNRLTLDHNLLKRATLRLSLHIPSTPVLFWNLWTKRTQKAFHFHIWSKAKVK